MTPKIKQNAHKVAYIVKAYPDKTLEELLGMLAMPAIDQNTSIWAAVELGLINEPDPQTGLTEFRSTPLWDFGPNVTELENTILYAYGKLASNETDLDEQVFTNWLSGYAPQDILIAVKHLEETNKLTQYAIEDGENTYLFYTLQGNQRHLWGRKQFKDDPLAEKKSKKKSKKDKSNG